MQAISQAVNSNPKARKLIAALLQVQGSSIASIDATTAVALKGGKKNPHQGRITKKARGARIMLFTNTNHNAYKAMVERRLVAEGKNASDFQLSPRPWGQRIAETPFVENKDTLYVEAVFLSAPTEVTYLLDGQPIAKSDIQGLEEKREEGEQGGLENKVIIRTYKLESIDALRMGANSVF